MAAGSSDPNAKWRVPYNAARKQERGHEVSVVGFWAVDPVSRLQSALSGRLAWPEVAGDRNGRGSLPLVGEIERDGEARLNTTTAEHAHVKNNKIGIKLRQRTKQSPLLLYDSRKAQC